MGDAVGMKKWTVMVIPQSRGGTRTLHLHSFQIWMTIAILTIASFWSGFFARRYQCLAREVARLEEVSRTLQQSPHPAPQDGALAPEEQAEIEREIRAEYKARDARITVELNELYDVEAQIRKLQGLPPRLSFQGDRLLKESKSGGKGGGLGALSSWSGAVDADTDEMARPPHLIYGLSYPSADLIVQEVNLRTDSLKELVADMEALRARLERMPAIWPTNHPRRRLTSPFGYRKDPITWTIRHHDGVDIAASYGSTVRATGKGVVKFSAYDHWLGHLIKIDHGEGIESWYGHLAQRQVQVGEEVERGQEIGLLGATGRTTGPHIHYEVHIDGRPVDPEKYLSD
jgi:murein DD-endopeptidase MepM/ murein hydrolase activator NlpD